jgi:ubiquitin-activating enzyme E1
MPARAAAVSPRNARHIKIDAKAEKKPPSVDSEEISRIDERLAEFAPLIGNPKWSTVEEFEKDHDANSHMDFVALAANIRAINSEISLVETIAIKKITSKIIQATITTTAKI